MPWLDRTPTTTAAPMTVAACLIVFADLCVTYSNQPPASRINSNQSSIEYGLQPNATAIDALHSQIPVAAKILSTDIDTPMPSSSHQIVPVDVEIPPSRHVEGGEQAVEIVYPGKKQQLHSQLILAATHKKPDGETTIPRSFTIAAIAMAGLCGAMAVFG